MAKEDSKNKPRAYPLVKRDVNGDMYVELISLETGLPVPPDQESYYEVYDTWDNAVDYMNSKPVTAEEKKTGQSVAKKVKEAYYSSAMNGHKDPNLSGDYKAGRYQENNFGFINKPGWTKVANMIPGPIGLAAKGINTAINVNNVAAKNTVREAMGLPALSGGAQVKGILGGVNGDVARMNAPNGKQYTVGLTALDAQGRTTLTRDEANKRGIAGVENEVLDGTATKSQGLLGKLTDALKTATTPTETPASQVSTSPGIFGKLVDTLKEGNIVGKLTGIDFDKGEVKETALPSGNVTATGIATPSVADAYRSIPQVQDVNTGQVTSGDDTSNIADGSFGGLATDQAGRFGGNAAISYANIGPGRPHAVSKQHEDYLSGVVGGVLGDGATVGVNSGDINPSDPGWGGKLSRSHRHTDEMGADVTFTKPGGGMLNYNNPQDRVALGDIAMSAAAKNPDVGLGFGLGYMGPNTMHIDQSGLGRMWGGNIADLAYSGTDVNNIDFARQTGIGPTPTYNAPTPQDVNSLRAPSDMDYFGDDEKSIARAKIDAVFDSIMAQASRNIATQTPTRDQYGVPISRVKSISYPAPTDITYGQVAKTAQGPINNFTQKPAYTTPNLAKAIADTPSYSRPASTLGSVEAPKMERQPATTQEFTRAMNDRATPSISAPSTPSTPSTPSGSSSLRSERTTSERASRSSSSLGSPSSAGKSSSSSSNNHSSERERDTSLGGGNSNSSGRSSPSGANNHSSEHERDSSLGGGNSNSSGRSSPSGANNHSSEHERDSSLGGGGLSGGFSSSGSPSRGIGRA